MSSTQIKLDWDAVTVDGGVKEYRIYKGYIPAFKASTKNTTYTDSGLTANQINSYRVSAVTNIGGVESEKTTMLDIRTLA